MSLDAMLDDVRSHPPADRVGVLLTHIKNQLRDALNGEKLSPGAEARLAAIMPPLETRSGDISDAINDHSRHGMGAKYADKQPENPANPRTPIEREADEQAEQVRIAMASTTDTKPGRVGTPAG